VFAGREELMREGWRERKGQEAGRKGGKGGRRGAAEVWGGRGAGGGGEKEKQAAKETNQIMQKNKSAMMDDLGNKRVNADMFHSQTDCPEDALPFDMMYFCNYRF
jgi:hypothetical protein